MRVQIRNLTDYSAKFFFFIMYAEDSFDWIRRCDFRFAVDRRPLERKFTITIEEASRVFTQLQNVGWIYNYRRDKFTHRFSVRPPMWLDLSEIGRMTNRYVPVDKAYGEEGTNRTKVEIDMFNATYEANQKKLVDMVTAEETKARTPEEILGG